MPLVRWVKRSKYAITLLDRPMTMQEFRAWRLSDKPPWEKRT